MLADHYEILRCLEMRTPRTSNAISRDLDWPLAQVRKVLRALRSMGWVDQANRGYRITRDGADSMERHQVILRLKKVEKEISFLGELIRDLLPKAADPTVTSAEIQAVMMDLDPVDKELYDRLRTGRNCMAMALGIQEYQLGQNRSLRMISDMQSRSEQPLQASDIIGLVPGMTPKTWARVGQTYLAIMDRWVKEQGIVKGRRQLGKMEVPP